MKNLFNSPFRITQLFGVNAAYYKQFGLKGHEGIDLVPTSSDWSVLSLEDGLVVRDEDNPRSGAYGVYLTLWNKENARAFQYCHLEKNNFKVGDTVKKGQVLGKMGSTGNTTGAHVHLNQFKTDGNGVRLNRTNGYQGGVNPLPFLESSDPPSSNELEKCVRDRDSHWNDRIAVCKALELPEDSTIDTITRSIAAYKGNADKVPALESQLATIKSAHEAELVTLKQQLLDKDTVVAQLQSMQGDLVTPYIEQLKAKDEQITAMAEEIRKLKLEQPKVSFWDYIRSLFTK